MARGKVFKGFQRARVSRGAKGSRGQWFQVLSVFKSTKLSRDLMGSGFNGRYKFQGGSVFKGFRRAIISKGLKGTEDEKVQKVPNVSYGTSLNGFQVFQGACVSTSVKGQRIKTLPSAAVMRIPLAESFCMNRKR